MVKKSWWQRIRERDVDNEKINATKDLEAVIEFLNEIKFDVQELLPLFKKLLDLERERQVATSGIVHVNLETQANLLDKILEKYEFLQGDAEINGIRVKAVAEQFIKNAKAAGMTDLVKEKKQDKRWKFFW
ncbi:hypothetical protein COY27_02270 [Candidatus Woesearchaeota archaeon CG_4_10_14_0_2_um_filter_33_13]|nr:MAG: hypothetical protein COY27_02270 [Candidatus Woesearchaeota archaeon CG_4_10_14_0_2_um_filter_33_13]